MQNGLSVVLVMPAYNEQDCIEEVVGSWHAELTQSVGSGRFGLLVVDSSRDETPRLLEAMRTRFPELIVHFEPPNGHGGALVAGYTRAVELGAEFVFQIDSDNQVLPADFGKLWSRRHDSDFILARRRVRHDPGYRKVMSRIWRLAVTLLFGCSVPDPNVPFRLMRAGFLATLLPELPRPTIIPNTLLTILAARRGIDLLHIPVEHRSRATGAAVSGRRMLRACMDAVHNLMQLWVRLRRN